MKITQSKPIAELKKGDKIKVDKKEYEVDAHCIMVEHGDTKEMMIDIFIEKDDVDAQVRYFDDQVESSIEFYVLKNEIMYERQDIESIQW